MAALPKLLLGLALAAGSAASASAQEWRVSFGKELGHGGIRVDVGSKGWHDRRDRDCAPPRCDGGYYETVEERVWIEGCTERVWVPARYETWVDACGHRHKRLVCEGHYETVTHPGHYEVRTRRVWVPERCGSRHDDHRGRGITIRR